MNVHEIIKNYYGYQLFYYLQPGLWMDNNALLTVKNALNDINKLSGKNFTYGIFSRSDDLHTFREFLTKTNLCLMKLEDEPIGFFYNVIIQEKPIPIIHAGLVVITKNKGIDLLTGSYTHLAILQWKKYGAYYYTNISSTPSIIGAFSLNFSQVWPSHCSKNLLKPPHKNYYEVLTQLYQEYIVRYFPEQEIQIDFKRFIMKSPSKEMGFETNSRNLARHKQLLVNLFCNCWLDYSQGEDLIQIGRVTVKFYFKSKLFLTYLALKRVFQFKKLFLGIFRKSNNIQHIQE